MDVMNVLSPPTLLSARSEDGTRVIALTGFRSIYHGTERYAFEARNGKLRSMLIECQNIGGFSKLFDPSLRGKDEKGTASARLWKDGQEVEKSRHDFIHASANIPQSREGHDHIEPVTHDTDAIALLGCLVKHFTMPVCMTVAHLVYSTLNEPSQAGAQQASASSTNGKATSSN